MSSSPVYMFGVFIFGIFMLFMIDISAYHSNLFKAERAAVALTNVGQQYGEITEENVEAITSKYNLPSDKWDITFTEGPVQHDEPIVVTVNTTYKITILSFLEGITGNSNVGSVPIRLHREVLSKVYHR